MPSGPSRNSRSVRSCVPPRFLIDRDRLPDLAAMFEVPEQHHGVGQIAGVDGRRHLGSDETLVRADEDGGDAHLSQVHQQLVQLNRQMPLSGMAFR